MSKKLPIIEKSPIIDFVSNVYFTIIIVLASLTLTWSALYIYVAPDVIDLMSKKSWVVVSLILLMTSLTLATLLIQKHYKLKAVSQNNLNIKS